MFETNYANAKASGVKVGAYHYSYAKTVAAATTEANFFISELKGISGDVDMDTSFVDYSPLIKSLHLNGY